jgi:putative CocE/NonD family hydrolase
MTSTRFGDRAVSRALHLPAPTTGYRVHRRLAVPMRDGVQLRADHYEPLTDQPLGTILVRCPYGRGFPFSFIYAQVYAARGYHVVLQSVRGTFGSGGTFVPMVHEADDAADTVVWLREQPWFTGTFGTIGLSYLGYAQWALLSDPPPELAAAVISVGPHDFHGTSWGTGSFALSDFLGWSDMMAHQERSQYHRLTHQFRAARRLASAVHHVPLSSAGRNLLGERSPWYESWIEHPDVDDPFWEPMRMTHALDRCSVPVLLISGWQDIFIDQTITQYQHLRRRGMDVAMTVGPWTHDQMVTKANGNTTAETLTWLGSHLAGKSVRRRSQPVRVYITGGARRGWVDLPDWPPLTTERTFYLQPGGGLGAGVPAAATSSFRYEPADPTPTVGGRLLSRPSGYTDDSALAQRSDVLSFTSTPLDGEVCVYGHPVIELDYETDNPHYDVFVRISEVDPRGRSRNVSDGYRRFDTAGAGPIRLELDPIAHRFAAGSRIRVLVAGGCHPRFARNLGTGEPAISGHRMVPSTHTIKHGPGTRLVLPIGEPL